MKRSILFAALTVAALSAPAAFAQDTKPTIANPAMSMDMDKHAIQMQEKMRMMRGMGGSMMTGGGQHGSMMRGGKKDGMMDGDMMKRHEMMEKRMDMTQMMMEQMMQRDQMMQSMPAK